MANSPSAADQPAFLQIQDLVKDFNGFKAVNSVNLDIAKGEIFALLGSSGCGKSTLLRMLAGFETPTSGRIILNGQDLARLPPYQRPMNMMFQSYALFPHLTVWENIAFGLKREGLPKDLIAERVEAKLKLVHSNWCNWASTRSASRTSSPAGSSSVSRWRAALPSSRSCCCWTSPWARWTRSCAKRRRSNSSTSSSPSASPA